MIVIVDYGMGNLGSVANMIKAVGGEAIISSKVEDIHRAKKLILPGVGAFDKGMINIRSLQLELPLTRKVLEEKVPVLGICLGMQLLTNSSEEGQEKGLGWIPGETIRFRFSDNETRHLKIPHIGWNSVVINRENLLLEQAKEERRFYFVHSYHVVCANERDAIMTTHYGYDFTSAVQRENIYGVQFHPEKSHKFGKMIMRNFCHRI